MYTPPLPHLLVATQYFWLSVPPYLLAIYSQFVCDRFGLSAAFEKQFSGLVLFHISRFYH